MDDLRAVSPEVSGALDNVLISNPKLYDAIESRVTTENSRTLTPNNSPNFYRNLKAALSNDEDSRLKNEFQLHNLLSRKDDTHINLKDYNDLNSALDKSPSLKTALSKRIDNIESAAGNVDGLGQQRALEFYRAATEYVDAKTKAGVSEHDLLDPLNKDYIGNLAGKYMPSRAEQMSNKATSVRGATAPILTTKDQFDKLASGSEYVRNGVRYRKP